MNVNCISNAKLFLSRQFVCRAVSPPTPSVSASCLALQAEAVLFKNNICRHAAFNVSIRRAANPTLRSNEIQSAKLAGICVEEGGVQELSTSRPTLSPLVGSPLCTPYAPQMPSMRSLCAIHAPEFPCAFENTVETVDGTQTADGDSAAWRMEIPACPSAPPGLGSIESNNISGNHRCGICVLTTGNPTVFKNEITKGTHNGVVIEEGGKGTFVGNKICNNNRCAPCLCRDWVAGRAMSQRPEASPLIFAPTLMGPPTLILALLQPILALHHLCGSDTFRMPYGRSVVWYCSGHPKAVVEHKLTHLRLRVPPVRSR